MAATLMDGKALAERIRARVADDVRALGGVGLTTVLVGDDPASDIYIRLKHKAATEAGMNAVDLRLPASTTEDELLAKIARAERRRRRSTRCSSSCRCPAGSTRTASSARSLPTRTSTASIPRTPASCCRAARGSCRRRRAA